MLIICFKSTSKIAHNLPVAQNCSGVTAEYLVGTFYHFVPFLVIKIEAGSKGIGGLAVEMVFGNPVIIVYKRQRSLNILVDGLVNLGNGTTGMFAGKCFNLF